MELSKEEVSKRLIRLRNLEHLYIKARERIDSLEKENKQLKERIKELERRNKDQNSKIETMAFQMEQVKNKLFWKKPLISRIFPKKDNKEQGIFSYRRPIPKQFTETKHYSVNICS